MSKLSIKELNKLAEEELKKFKEKYGEIPELEIISEKKPQEFKPKSLKDRLKGKILVLNPGNKTIH